MNYQTDFSGFIAENGCLFFCLIRIAELKAGKELTHIQVSNLIHILHHNFYCSYNKKLPVLSNEEVASLPGIFVWDHEAVIREALLCLSCGVRARYIGRKYMPWVSGRDFGSSFGATDIILQIKTKVGGHFRMLDYDSWEPGTDMIDLKSVRYYTLL